MHPVERHERILVESPSRLRTTQPVATEPGEVAA